MNKCDGCIFLGKYQDMGASTPLCLRGDKDLLGAIKAHDDPAPCKWHITKKLVETLQEQNANKTEYIKEAVYSVIETPDMRIDPEHLEHLEHHLATTMGRELLRRGFIEISQNVDRVNRRLRLAGRVQVFKSAYKEADT